MLVDWYGYTGNFPQKISQLLGPLIRIKPTFLWFQCNAIRSLVSRALQQNGVCSIPIKDDASILKWEIAILVYVLFYQYLFTSFL